MNNNQMSQNEIDFTILLQELSKTKTFSDTIKASLDRLVAQLPKPLTTAVAPVQDPAAAQKAEQERLEVLKGGRNPINRGMIMAPPSAEELAQQAEYKRQEQERKDRAARPSVPPRKAVA